MNTSLHITNARLMDPSSGRDEMGNIFVRDGIIVETPVRIPVDTIVINAGGHVVAPGLIDLHVHLREPGGEDAEDIESGSRAAARGGFTTIVAMPNTRPACDTPERVAYVLAHAEKAGYVRVLPAATITKERAGVELADLEALVSAGAAAFTDDGSTVQSDDLMEQAMKTAFRLGLPIVDHAQDRNIERMGGVMHEGERSRLLKLPGIPSYAEERIIKRDIELAERTGCAVHIQHVTSKEAASLIRDARARGIRVTAEVTPHHLTLTDEDVDAQNPNFKMNPPLRTRADRDALLNAIADGTISCLATDHAPHSAEKKALGFLGAPFGVVGLETAVGVTYSALVSSRVMSCLTWLKRWTRGPATVIGLPTPSLRPGARANLVLLDLRLSWTVDPKMFVSRSTNTPFSGRELTGRALCTILGGRITWQEKHV